MMLNALTNFLSNKINLVILQCISYFLIGWALKSYGITTGHMILICVLMFTISFLNHLLGISKGLFIATLHKKEINEFVKYMDTRQGDMSNIDEDLEELINNIEKKINKENDNE